MDGKRRQRFHGRCEVVASTVEPEAGQLAALTASEKERLQPNKIEGKTAVLRRTLQTFSVPTEVAETDFLGK